MHSSPSTVSIADWVRDHFGIDDEEELQALLADPSELMALLDVAAASGQTPNGE